MEGFIMSRQFTKENKKDLGLAVCAKNLITVRSALIN